MLRAIQLIIFGTTSSASGGGGGAPGLDFSSATNSQYIALVFGGYWGV